MPQSYQVYREESFNEQLFAVTRAVLEAAAAVNIKVNGDEAGRAAMAALMKLTKEGWELHRRDPALQVASANIVLPTPQ